MEITKEERRDAENVYVANIAVTRGRVDAITCKVPEEFVRAFVAGQRHGKALCEGDLHELMSAADHGIGLMIFKQPNDPEERLVGNCPQCASALRTLQKHGLRPHTKLESATA